MACLGIVALQIADEFGLEIPANPAQTLYAVAFAWLVASANHGIGGPIGAMLRTHLLVGMGTISYGVYVYHVFAPRIVGAAMRGLGVPEYLQAGLFLFAASLLLTIGVAVASWFLMERPLLRFRKLH